MRRLAFLLAFAFASIVHSAPTPCHILTSGKDGPTVIVRAGGSAAGYAANQFRFWHLSRGRVIIVPSPDNSEELAGSARPASAEDLDAPALAAAWRLHLEDNFSPVPADSKDGNAIEVSKTEEGQRLGAELVDVLNSALPAEAATCQVDTAASPAGGRALTYRTDEPKLTLAARARQHRQFVSAFLSHWQMLAPETTPETIVDPAPPVRVAVFDGEGSAGAGVPNCLAQLRIQPGVAVTRIAAEDIAAGALAQFTVAMFTGGSGSRQAATLGEKGREQVVNFVRAGGGYVGICAGSYLACKGFSWGLGVINAKTPSSKWQRGRGLVKIELNEAGRAVLGDIRGETDCRYGNGPLLVPAGAAELPPFEVLAWFRTELAEHGTPKGIMINSPAVIRSTFGKGRVLCISPHPEQTQGLETVIPRAVAWVAEPARGESQ